MNLLRRDIVHHLSPFFFGVAHSEKLNSMRPPHYPLIPSIRSFLIHCNFLVANSLTPFREKLHNTLVTILEAIR